MNRPESGRYSLKFKGITAKLAMMFGVRMAEELIYGTENVSTGASNDIQQATNMARRMVTEGRMSDKRGRLRYVDNQEELFPGPPGSRRHTSDGAPAKLSDGQIRPGIEGAGQEASTGINGNRDGLHRKSQEPPTGETVQ